MNEGEKIEMLKFSMNRCDHYYDSINNKGNLYLTLCTFLLGGVITGYYSIKDDLDSVSCPHYLMWVTLILNVLSIILTLLAIKPYISNKNTKSNKSLFYFGDISSVTVKQFNKDYSNANSHFFYEDLLKQISILSKGLRGKFYLLRLTTYLIIVEFTAITIIAFYILK